MDQEIISRLRKRIVAEGLDAIIASSPENVTYVSGFVVPSQSLMRWRHAAVIVTADGRIAMVAIDMEATTVKAHAGIDDLKIYREFTDDPMDKLADALKDLKLDRSKVGIEMEFLPAKDFATLQKKLPRGSLGRLRMRFSTKLGRSKRPGNWRCCVRLASSRIKRLAMLSDPRSRYERDGVGRDFADCALWRRRGELQADDHRVRRAQPVSQRRPYRAKIAARRHHSHGDLRPEERLSYRRLPHRGGRRCNTRAI